MLKNLKNIHTSAQSDDKLMPPMTDLEPTGVSNALAKPETPSKRSRIIGILQILLVLLLMAVAVYYSR